MKLEPMAPVLNRRLALEEERRLPDGAGGWTRSWATLGVLWGSVTASSGREVEVGERERASVSHRVLVRSAPVGSAARPRADQRFREGTRIFGIKAVAEADPRGRFLICWVDEEAVA